MGYSYEKRPIQLISLSLNSSENNEPLNKKAIFLECGIHSSEWISPAFWCEIFVLFSPPVPSKREKNIFVYCFRELCLVFTFQFLNDRIHNYVKKHNCEFYHSKIAR